MYEAEVLQSLAILLLEVSPELCTVEKLQKFFETLFVGTPAANIKEIHINSMAVNAYSNDTKDNTSCSAQNVNKEEADGDEVAVVLFHTTEATRCVLERVEVVSSGSAYNLELRRGYLELNKQRVLVEGVLSVSANTSATSSSSSTTTTTTNINATNAVITDISTPIVTSVINSNNSDNVTKTNAESNQGNINNTSRLVDGEKDKNKGSIDNLKNNYMKEEKLPTNMKEEKLSREKEIALMHCAPPVYTEPIVHQPCALHNNNLSNALTVDPSHEFVNTNHSNPSPISSNKHPVLYFTFISIHSSESVITPFIIYQILCGVCVPQKILVLKNVHSISSKYNISKNKKASDYHGQVERQHERQQRQHQRALVEVNTIDEAYDVIKYFDNIRVELMSSSVNNMQQLDSTTTTSTHDNTDANVEMRFIIRVRLSTSRNESSSAFNSESELEEHATSGLQLRGNTMYSLELTNTNNESIGPAFDRQYEYRVEQQQHKAILVQSHNANNSVKHSDVRSKIHVSSNNNNIAPQLASEVSSVKMSHTPQWSSHQSKSSRANSNQLDHHSYVSYSSQSSTPSRSRSSSSFSSASSSSRSSSKTNSYRKVHKMEKGHYNTSFDDHQHRQQQHKHHEHYQNFSHEGKSAHERKRQHTPSLSVMKYKKARLHHGKDNNRHPNNLHNGENINIGSNNKKYDDEISSPLGISHLPNSNNVAPLYNVTSTYPLHEPCETHVCNSNVSDVPPMYSNNESTLANYDNGALPPNWRVVFSDEYQQVYYVYRDPVSGQESTTWTRPTSELPK